MLRKLLIKAIELYGKFGAFLKHRRLRSTVTYKGVAKNYSNGFAMRVSQWLLPEANVERIIDAYNLAVDKMQKEHLYYVSDEWVPLFKKYQGEVIESLRSGDVQSVRQTYANFFRDNISAGLCGLPTNMKRFYRGSASWLDRHWYILDCTWRISHLNEMHPGVRATDLQSPDIGNPYGYYWDGQFVRIGADYQYSFAQILKEQLPQRDSGSVLEIGGGYGGLAYFLLRDCPAGVSYTDIDLPENLALTTFYLMSIFPDANFRLFGENHVAEPETATITLLPSYEIEALTPGNYDVAFNSYSFAEMGFDAAQNYLNHLARLNVDKILHVNHTRNSATKADRLALSDRYLQVSLEESKWNWGRSLTADEYLFIYSRRRYEQQT